MEHIEQDIEQKISGIVAFDVNDNWTRYWFNVPKEVWDLGNPTRENWEYYHLIDYLRHSPGYNYKWTEDFCKRDIVWDYFTDPEAAKKWNPKEERDSYEEI